MVMLNTHLKNTIRWIDLLIVVPILETERPRSLTATEQKVLPSIALTGSINTVHVPSHRSYQLQWFLHFVHAINTAVGRS